MRVWGKRWVKISGPSARAFGPPPPRVKAQTDCLGTATSPPARVEGTRTGFSANTSSSVRSSSEPTHQYSARGVSPRPRRASGLLPSSLRQSPEVRTTPSPRLPMSPGSSAHLSHYWLLPGAHCRPRASAKPRRLCPKVVAAIVCRLKRGRLGPS